MEWPEQKAKSYEVEFVRPPVDDLDPEDLSAIDAARLSQEQTQDAVDQDTISLDTEDEKYVSYAGVVKQRIMAHWAYPEKAKEQLIEGKLLVIFSILRDGRMIQIQVAENSGSQLLDDEAVKAIRTAAPFPPFPGSVKVGRLNIKAAFDYRLTKKR